MNDYQIIVKIESQQCIRYETRPNGDLVSVIENVGIDKNGRRWQYYTNSVSRSRDNGMYLIHSEEPYGFIPLQNAPDND